MNDATTITLSLTIPQVNMVLQALGQGPYATVEPLITLIRGQAMPQIEGAPASAPEPVGGTD